MQLTRLGGHLRPTLRPRSPHSQHQGRTGRLAPVAHVASSYASTSSSSYDSDEDGSSFRVLTADMWVGDLVDYYAILEVDDDATTAEIKRAYRKLAKVCHPDFLGDQGHDICILLNEAYTVLSDDAQRREYNAKLDQALRDSEDEYTGKPLSKWIPTLKPSMAKNTDPNERRAVFVDEFSCIGCKQCVWHASATFRIEPDHGRSRVFAQWLDDEQRLQSAIQSCPVNCIHWVDRSQLAPLEHVMQKRMTQRTNVGVMMAGQGATADVFASTETFLKQRKRRAEAEAMSAKRGSYSSAQEKARRAAAKALRRATFGMFANFVDFMDSLADQMSATVSSNSEDNVRVGKRKRSMRWKSPSEALEASNADYYLVPPSRALVAVTVRSQEDAKH